MGASSDQFLRILYSGPPQVIFFAYREPSVQFLRILYGTPGPPPSDKFLCFLCGGLFRSVSSHTIWGASSGQFLRVLYVEAPLDNFLRLLYGAPSGQFLRLLYGAPLRSISLLPMWGPLQISFFVYYIGGPLRSLSLPIGGPQFSFFAYYMGPPSDQFFCFLCGGLFRSVSSHTIYSAPSGHFLRL